MPSDGRPRDNYDPLDKTFYYLRLRSRPLRFFFDRPLIRRSYFCVRFWIEMYVVTHIQSSLILAANCLRESIALTSQTSCSAIGSLVTVPHLSQS